MVCASLPTEHLPREQNPAPETHQIRNVQIRNLAILDQREAFWIFLHSVRGGGRQASELCLGCLLPENENFRFFSQFRGHPGDHNHQDFPKSTAMQMGGVLQYKWEAYCDTNGRSTASTPFP